MIIVLGGGGRGGGVGVVEGGDWVRWESLVSFGFFYIYLYGYFG